MKINTNPKPILTEKNISFFSEVSSTPKFHDIQKSKNTSHSSFLKDTSDYMSDKLIEVGDWWSEKKNINNETTKRALEDSETVTGILKDMTKKVGYGVMNGVAKVANATTSILDVTESYANDVKNNRNNLPETLNTIVKGSSQSIIAGVVTTGVATAIGAGAAPIVIGGVVGGLAAYGFGKVYDFLSSF